MISVIKVAVNPDRSSRAAKLRRLAAMRNKIVDQRLNVYPNTPVKEKPKLAHRISALCQSYADLKAELG